MNTRLIDLQMRPPSHCPHLQAKLTAFGLVFLIGLFHGIFVSTAFAQWFGGLPSKGMRVRNAMIPFYIGLEQEPSAVLRADRIFTDYERHGFFRIGLLPLGVMERVVVEVRHPELVINSLAEVHHWLKPKAGSRLELREVKFLMAASPTNRLEAGRARPLPAGAWELFDGVRLVAGTTQIQALRAKFQMIGKDAGRLELQTEPAQVYDLFAVLTDSKPTNERNSR